MITAEKLNAITVTPLIVHTKQQEYGYGIDVSFNDIASAINAERPVYYFGDVDNSFDYNALSSAYGDYTNNSYQVYFANNMYVSQNPDEHMYSPG